MNFKIKFILSSRVKDVHKLKGGLDLMILFIEEFNAGLSSIV